MKGIDYMYKNGFVKVCAVTPTLLVGNPLNNVKEILKSLKEIDASIAAFPELCITSYTCNDLFFQHSLLNDSLAALDYLLKNNPFDGVLVVGMPLDVEGALYNTALVIQKKQILGIVPKHYLPNTDEFYEKRWFKSGADIGLERVTVLNQNVPFGNILFQTSDGEIRFGVEICEDMWAPISPGNILSVNGANMIINLSASNEVLGKDLIRKNAVLDHSRRNGGAYLYVSAGVNESTSETVFSGHNIIASLGELIVETENFSQETEIIYGDIDISKINFKRRKNSSLRDSLNMFPMEMAHVSFDLPKSENYLFTNKIDELPFVPSTDIEKKFNKIASLQEYALYKRLKHINTHCVIIGVSGGLDSTLALLIAHQAFLHLGWDTKGIIAVTMPGLGTSLRTKNNASKMMEKLNVTVLEKDIKDSVNEHFSLIGHDKDVHDLTYENVQARMRTLILMDLATKYQGFVLGTGDLSELALGWCTYNGDQMSMYGINAGIPKTMVRFMITNYAKYKYTFIKDTLDDIVATPISPELSGSDQHTEDAIGKYEINDFILNRFLSCGDDYDRIIYIVEEVFKMNMEVATSYVKNFFKRFYSQQFKRQALPDGPKIIDISLAPRSDFRMPSDVKR